MSTFEADQRSELIERVTEATAAGQLTSSAAENIQQWLDEPRYADFQQSLAEHIQQGQWQQLDDVFWTVIPFGTGGRRGRMYPIGSNAINDRTIGESAAGLAEYVKQQAADGAELSCAIGFDTRHRSRHFAELCAGIMVAQGFTVYILDQPRPTPELSFLVRQRSCDCGIMVTASHNPPSDNAVKVYWSSGGQIVPPHDQLIIQQVADVQLIETVDYQQAVSAGQVIPCTEEIDGEYLVALSRLSMPAGNDLKILYSPLHGVGASAVPPLLSQQGFDELELYPDHAQPDGDFPNVPDHVANPENAAVFDKPIEYARQHAMDIVLATDPDCDRMGCAAPLTLDTSGPWQVFNGNQLSALLADFVLEHHQHAGTLSDEDYVVTTLVTTGMVRRIAESYGVQTRDQLLVGFKWICSAIDQYGPQHFLYGTEESHGFLTGTHVRDKDGPNACLAISQLAAKAKAAGQSLVEKLDSLYWQHGLHDERLWTIRMEGSQGMQRMQELMSQFRQQPPSQLGGQQVVAIRDYLQQIRREADGSQQSLAGPHGNLLIMELEETGNLVAVRPSGTEPKIKFYGFAYRPAEQLSDLPRDLAELHARMDQVEKEMQQLAGL